jgi:hypothetical protein
MNKWIVAFGSFLMLIVTAWALPITINNPSTNNIVMTSIFGILTILGLYTFAKSPKDKKDSVMQGLTPVD